MEKITINGVEYMLTPVENETVNKTEPKFKVGDWIVSNFNTVCYVESISEKNYHLRLNDGYHEKMSINYVDRNFHLWTIADAKDGDVLYHKAENGIEYIVMNKSLNEHNNIDSYFRYSSINGFGTDIPSVLSAKCDSITPATKEQRDLLFQKMKEAGYEWDAEKKELNKIKDEEYNGEDYGIDSLYHAQRILEKTLGKVDGYQTDDGILEHKCAITAVKKLYKQKSAEWSEEDERMFDYALDMIEWYSGKNEDKSRLVSDWLKSLKPQNRWKPSDEQMNALLFVRQFWKKEVLSELYEQLKKL